MGSFNFRYRGVAIPLLILVVLIAGSLWSAGKIVSPWARNRALGAIQGYFGGQAKFGTLRLAFHPELVVSGTDLRVELPGAAGVPPLVSIQRFSARVGFIGLLRRPLHLRNVHLEGLRITVPRGEAKGHSGKGSVPAFVIDETKVDRATLIIIPKKEGRDPLEFDLHNLTLHGAGKNGAMSFQAALTNAKPRGEIHTTGTFGPWQAEDPRETAVSGEYVFRRADLSSFKGLKGTLSSQGSFQGTLEHIETAGETDTPDFALTISGNPVHLKTQFKAVVDGTDGNTYLHRVTGQFGHSAVETQGQVAGMPGGGKTVSLDVKVNNARLEDLLRLVVSGQPSMTGAVSFQSKFAIPPGEQAVAEKIRMDGQFEVGSALFSNSSAQQKVDDLSKRGRGHPQDENQTVTSDFRGDFHLDHGLVTFQKLGFKVPGVSVILDGTYGLESAKLDFQGTAQLEGKLSQATTGFKSFLLKAADPFFKKGNAGAVLPIKIAGTSSSPSFGLNLKQAKK